MAEPDERSMSIIPYSPVNRGDREVYFQWNNALVLYDSASKQVVLQQDPKCPECHQSLPESWRAEPFVNPKYFHHLRGREPEVTARSSSAGIPSDAFSPGYFKRFFREKGLLGRGGKGVVLLVEHILHNVTLGDFACKRVPVGDNNEWLAKVLSEVQTLQGLNHPNLVAYKYAWLEDMKLSNFGPSVPCLFILQRYCNSGDLQKHICGEVRREATPQELKERARRKSKGEPEPPHAGPVRLPLDQIYSFFKDIASGLNYLHEHGYIHRDLKPNNCLLHKENGQLQILVSDFGEVQTQNAVRASTGTTGTVSYCAPEVLRRESPGGPYGNFTFSSDVFSLGMILHFLCFADLPYENANAVDEDKEDIDLLRDEISHWDGFNSARHLRKDLPDELYTFLKRLLAVDPNQRPTVEKVLNEMLVIDYDGHFYGHSRTSAERRPSLHPYHDEDINSTSESESSSISDADSSIPRQSRPYSGYGTNNTLEIRRPPEPITGARDRRFSNGALLPAPTDYSIAYPATDRHRLQAANHLLLPPPTRFSLGTIFRYQTSTYIPLVLALLKFTSISRPCSPAVVNPWIFYPLLFLGGADLTTRRSWVHALTLIIHIAIIFVAFRLEKLCI